jgi:hypothetical protein
MSVAVKSNPSLWERAKSQAKAKMGGKHSARAMQLAVSIYKKAGGSYKGAKSSSNKLSKWTKEKWGTKSGKPSGQTGERYLPKKAIKSLSSKDNTVGSLLINFSSELAKSLPKEETGTAQKGEATL